MLRRQEFPAGRELASKFMVTCLADRPSNGKVSDGRVVEIGVSSFRGGVSRALDAASFGVSTDLQRFDFQSQALWKTNYQVKSPLSSLKDVNGALVTAMVTVAAVCQRGTKRTADKKGHEPDFIAREIARLQPEP